jgi:hypothetical protein
MSPAQQTCVRDSGTGRVPQNAFTAYELRCCRSPQPARQYSLMSRAMTSLPMILNTAGNPAPCSEVCSGAATDS